MMPRFFRAAVVLSCAAALLGGVPNAVAGPASLLKRGEIDEDQLLETSASRNELGQQPLIITHPKGPTLQAAIGKNLGRNGGARLSPEKDLYKLHDEKAQERAVLMSRPLTDAVVNINAFAAYLEEDREGIHAFPEIAVTSRLSDKYVIGVTLICGKANHGKTGRRGHDEMHFADSPDGVPEQRVYVVLDFDDDWNNHCFRFAKEDDFKQHPRNSTDWKTPNLVSYNHMAENLRDAVFNSPFAYGGKSARLGRRQFVPTLVNANIMDLVTHQAWPTDPNFPPDGSDGLPDWAVRDRPDR